MFSLVILVMTLLFPLQVLAGGGYYEGGLGHRRPFLGYGTFVPGLGLDHGLAFPGFDGFGYRGYHGASRGLRFGGFPFIGPFGIGRGHGHGAGYLG